VKNKMRKAQAALEFLTTYGWAFIVILVMIGALAYFGVLNPSKVTPNRCIVEAGLTCTDFQITSSTASIALTNGKGEGMTISEVNVSYSSLGTSVLCDVNGATPSIASPVQVTDGGLIDISCDVSGFTLGNSVGDKVKMEFTVNYRMSKGTYDQKFSGSIYGQVQS
jgi:hypothetical protein